MDSPHLVKFLGLFAQLNGTQKIQLKKCLNHFVDYKVLAPVVRGTARFALDIELFPLWTDVSFWSCLSIAKFITAFLWYQIRNSISENPHLQNKREIERQVVTQVNFTEIRSEFLRIRDYIRALNPPLPINFRDDFTAIYHYCKHRIEGSSTITDLAVDEYYDMIRAVIDRVQNFYLYNEMKESGNTMDLTYSVFRGNDSYSRRDRCQVVDCVLGLREGKEPQLKTAYRKIVILPSDGYQNTCGWIRVNAEETVHYDCSHNHGENDWPLKRRNVR